MNTPMNAGPGQRAPEMQFDQAKIRDPEYLHKTRHDIRTAMHVVTGMSEVLSLSSTVPPREREILATIKRNAGRALTLIDNVFDTLEQLEQGDQQPPAKDFAQPRQARREDDRRAPEAAFTETPKPRLRALVVEDNESNALVITSFLETLKYDYDLAPSGEEALKKFAQSHYDVIIMDVQMRGMDGLETTRRIRDAEMERKLPATPILGATGNATQDDKLFCSRAGMTDYISKPFSRKELERKLLCALPLFRRSLN
ncbi:MAG: response regulator [Alphaproteobacteria bacterium]